MAFAVDAVMEFLLPAFSHTPFATGFLNSIVLPTPGQVGVPLFVLLCLIAAIPPAAALGGVHALINRCVAPRFHRQTGFFFAVAGTGVGFAAALCVSGN